MSEYKEEEIIKSEIKNLKKNINLRNQGKILNLVTKRNNYADEIKEPQTVLVSGASGIGKTIFIILFSKILEKNNNKILLIEFNKNDIKFIYGIKENTAKINNNIDLFDRQVEFNNEINHYEKDVFYNTIKKAKNDYQYIIFEDNNENDSIKKYLFEIVDKILFLVEPNILGIKKANMTLEVLEKDFKIRKDKIKIVFYKSNEYTIDCKILKDIYNEFEVLGEVKYSKKIDIFINRNTRYEIDKNEVENIYKKLIK